MEVTKDSKILGNGNLEERIGMAIKPKEQNYLLSISEELKHANEKLKKENLDLKSENLHLQTELDLAIKKIQSMKNYTLELEAELNNTKVEIEQKNVALEQVNEDIDRFSSQVDELIGLIMGLEMEKQEGVYPQSSMEFLQDVELQNDKDLIFGINIKQEFLQNNSANTIKYYLFACECKIRESFEVINLQIRSKEDLALVGEAFAQYVRVASLSKGESLQGFVEILPATILDNPIIRYYGSVSVTDYFDEFVRVYSHQPKTKATQTPLSVGAET